jgi:hypothetical protein
MTRAGADQVDSDAAHSPPPFPTVLALDLRIRGTVYFSLDRIQEKTGEERMF